MKCLWSRREVEKDYRLLEEQIVRRRSKKSNVKEDRYEKIDELVAMWDAALGPYGLE